jgi:hypothetical protein
MNRLPVLACLSLGAFTRVRADLMHPVSRPVWIKNRGVNPVR